MRHTEKRVDGSRFLAWVLIASAIIWPAFGCGDDDSTDVDTDAGTDTDTDADTDTDTDADADTDTDEVEGPAVECSVTDGILTCVGSGLVTGEYTALNADLQDCGEANYGIDGISENFVGEDGTVTYVVDLAHMEFFGFGPLPTECEGPHLLMVAYTDGIAVASTTVTLSLP